MVYPQTTNPQTSGGQTPLRVKLTAYGAQAGQGVVKEVLVSPMFMVDGGRRSGSPHVKDMRILESLLPPRSTNPSQWNIRQPRRPNTSAGTVPPPFPFHCCQTDAKFTSSGVE